MTIGLIVGEILRRHIKLKSPVLGKYMKTLTLDVGNEIQTHVSHGGHSNDHRD
jgi:hypothetical protein